MPELEEKKKKLEEIRNFYKPIERTEFEHHAKHYEKYKKKKNEEIRRDREKSIQDERDRYENLKYKPKLSDQLKQELDEVAHKREREEEEKKKRTDKMTNYSKIVK